MKTLTVVGRIGQGPELKYAQGGMAMLKLSVACDYREKQQGGGFERATLWVRVTVFGKRAESLQKVLEKGMRIATTGDMEVRQYESNGKAGVSIEIIANDVEPLFDKGPGMGGQKTPAADDDDRIPW